MGNVLHVRRHKGSFGRLIGGNSFCYRRFLCRRSVLFEEGNGFVIVIAAETGRPPEGWGWDAASEEEAATAGRGGCRFNTKRVSANIPAPNSARIRITAKIVGRCRDRPTSFLRCLRA